MLVDGVKGSSVRMTMYVRVAECTVLQYMYSTYDNTQNSESKKQ